MRVRDLAKCKDKHMLSPQCLEDYANGKKALFVWVLEKAKRLGKPVTIPRSYGTWVFCENKP